MQGVAAGVERRLEDIAHEEVGAGFRLQREEYCKYEFAIDVAKCCFLLSFIHIKLNLECKSRPGCDSGDLVRWVKDPTGCEGVGGAGVGHALTRVVHCKTHNQISYDFFFTLYKMPKI